MNLLTLALLLTGCTDQNEIDFVSSGLNVEQSQRDAQKIADAYTKATGTATQVIPKTYTTLFSPDFPVTLGYKVVKSEGETK